MSAEQSGYMDNKAEIKAQIKQGPIRCWKHSRNSGGGQICVRPSPSSFTSILLS
ncbi:580_t:CDS:2 [Entrophospora sp. SA101]|nr:580_t:CDS:2 [Entrophospora sp. SA101]